MKDFDRSLLESGEVFKQGYSSLIGNLGKTTAVITAIVAVLVTFTDITFASLAAREVTSVLCMLLMSAYIIYFSLEDAGEREGERTEEYTAACKKYCSLRERITPDMIPALRCFAAEYSREETEYRRKNELMRLGYSEAEYRDFLNGKRFSGKARRALKRVKKIKPMTLTAQTLLAKERTKGKSELYNPERTKLLRLTLKLIPSTLCMIVTVSIVLSTKDGLGASEIAEGIMKLSALPVVGIKGYLAGYNYAKDSRTVWLETKSRLIEMFLDGENKEAV